MMTTYLEYIVPLHPDPQSSDHDDDRRQRIVGRATLVEKIAAQVFFILCRLSLLLLPFCHFEFPGVHRAGQGSRIRRFRRRIHDTTWNFSWHLSSFISWYLFSLFTFSKLFYRLPNFTEYFSEPSFRPRLPTYFLSLRQGTRIGNMSGMNTAITYSIQHLENIWKPVW